MCYLQIYSLRALGDTHLYVIVYAVESNFISSWFYSVRETDWLQLSMGNLIRLPSNTFDIWICYKALTSEACLHFF